MDGKVVVITGATSGIGEVAAKSLAEQGARIVLIARNPERVQTVLQALNAITPSVKHTVYYADLSKVADMKRVALEIAAAEPVIDVLMNNAGAIFNEYEETEDGFEITFATNHLAYYVITNLLLNSLKAANKARIVNTASSAHSSSPDIDLDDVQQKEFDKPVRLYGLNKLYNILFTKALAKRLEDTEITVNCFHPGFIRSRFASQSTGWFYYVFSALKTLFAISPEKGADTMLYLATSEELDNKSGDYYFKRALKTPTEQAQSEDFAQWLWQKTEELIDLNITV